MAKSNRNLTDIFQDTANAIRSKTGSSATINPRDFADEIDAIPTGGGAPIDTNGKNVIVYDYDGTVLDAQTVAVGQEYTLPEGPTHEGLTFDGWSCSTAPVNGKITIPSSKEVRVGAMYKTTSGALELDIVAPKNIAFVISSGSSGDIDWGDGTVDSNTSHTYAQEGEYTVKFATTSNLSINSSMLSSFAYATKRIRLPNTIDKLGGNAFANFRTLETITIPNNVTWTTVTYAIFNNCTSLKSIVVPNNVTKLASSFASGCFAMKNIVIPSSVTTFESPFGNMYALKDIVFPNGATSFPQLTTYNATKIIIPNGVTSLASSTFSGCYHLTSISIPSGISSIPNSLFANCKNCGVYDFSQYQSVPTLQNSNAFSGIGTNAKIIVPDSLYETWVGATNWSDLSSYIIKASEA